MLTVITEFRKGILFVRLNGHLTSETIDILNEKVIETIKEQGIRNVVFNLSELVYIDIKGINSLFNIYELCRNNEGRSLLCGNNINIEKKLKKSRLINYIYEISDELSAIKILNLR